MVRLLDGLPDLDDDRGWYHQSALARLQDLHYHVLAILVDLATDDGDADVEQGWLDTSGDRLTSDEASLLRRVVARPRRIRSLLRWSNHELSDQVESAASEDDANGDDTAPAPTTHPLLDLADAYHATITTLIQRTAGTAEAGGVWTVPTGRTR
jgi:hypothetical protein